MKKIIGIIFAFILIIPALVTAQTLLNQHTQTWNNSMCTFNIKSGWNLVPLEALHSASGQYWTNYRSNLTTCDQSIARNAWMWSPVAGKYENFVMSDWDSPDSRSNQFLINEFGNKYFHVYYGSAWIYSKKDCMLTRTGFPAGMAAKLSSNQLEPSKDETYFENLTLKSGWNFVAIDTWMQGKTLADVFSYCTISKINSWNPNTRQWNLGSSEMESAANNLDNYEIPLYSTNDEGGLQSSDAVFGTVLVRVNGDCRISMTSSSGPPPLPE